MQIVMLNKPINIGGVNLPSMISLVRSGDTNNWSNVPSSRSRAIERAVTISPVSSAMLAMRFGTMNHR